MRAVLFGCILALSAGAAEAGEEWLVVKGDGGAWAYDKGGETKSEAMGFTFSRLARYYTTPQTEDGATFSFDVRSYRIDCSRGRMVRLNRERYTNGGVSVPTPPPADDAPPEPNSKSWFDGVKGLVCEGKGLDKAVKAPSKVSALALMMTVAGK